MSEKVVRRFDRITSAVAANVNGEPIYVGGNLFNIHVRSTGAAIAAVDVSNDKANWVEDTGTLGVDSLTAVTSRPLWARARTGNDAGGPSVYSFGFAIFKDS